MKTRKEIARFGGEFGGPWIPVRFCSEMPEGERRALRFCEAVKEGQRAPVVLIADSVSCPGAKRSFGWSRGLDEELAEKLSRNQELSLASAKKAIRRVPTIDDGVVAVEVGTLDEPDVLVSFAQPATAMKISRACEKGFGEPLQPLLSSVLSVCGNIAVRSHFTGDVTVSVGCSSSRESSAIGRDRLIIGVPWKKVPDLLEAAK